MSITIGSYLITTRELVMLFPECIMISHVSHQDVSATLSARQPHLIQVLPQIESGWDYTFSCPHSISFHVQEGVFYHCTRQPHLSPPHDQQKVSHSILLLFCEAVISYHPTESEWDNHFLNQAAWHILMILLSFVVISL